VVELIQIQTRRIDWINATYWTNM